MAKTLIKKDVFLFVLGIFSLVVGIAAILNSIYTGRASQILWMCYISMILIGVGIIRKNNYILLSQSYIITLPLLIWNIDFIYYLITGNPLFGITDYFFEQNGISIGRLISLQHLFTLPLTFFAIRVIGKIEKNALNFSFLQLGIVFLLSRFLTPEDMNINCVFTPCVNFLSQLVYYQVYWFFSSFIIVGISAYVINRLPFLNAKNL